MEKCTCRLWQAQPSLQERSRPTGTAFHLQVKASKNCRPVRSIRRPCTDLKTRHPRKYIYGSAMPERCEKLLRPDCRWHHWPLARNSMNRPPSDLTSNIAAKRRKYREKAKNEKKNIDEQEDWIENIKRSTKEAEEQMTKTKIPCWIETHRRMKWRMASLPEERWSES